MYRAHIRVAPLRRRAADHMRSTQSAYFVAGMAFSDNVSALLTVLDGCNASVRRRAYGTAQED